MRVRILPRICWVNFIAEVWATFLTPLWKFGQCPSGSLNNFLVDVWRGSQWKFAYFPGMYGHFSWVNWDNYPTSFWATFLRITTRGSLSNLSDKVWTTWLKKVEHFPEDLWKTFLRMFGKSLWGRLDLFYLPRNDWTIFLRELGELLFGSLDYFLEEVWTTSLRKFRQLPCGQQLVEIWTTSLRNFRQILCGSGYNFPKEICDNFLGTIWTFPEDIWTTYFLYVPKKVWIYS